MNDFLKILLGSQAAQAPQNKEESDAHKVGGTFPSELVDDGGFTQNVLMKGLPGMEDPTPPFTGINGVAWTPEGPKGPVAVTSDDLPPSPIKPELQALTPAAKPPVVPTQQAAVQEMKKQGAKQKAAVAEAPKGPEAPPEAPKTEEAQPSALDKLLQSYNEPTKDNELAGAQAKRNEILRQLAMLRGFEQIGAGLGGFTSKKDFLEDQMGLAGQPVKDIEQRREQERKMKEDKAQGLKLGMDVERFKMDSEAKGIDLQKAKLQLKDAQANKDPNSDISKATRQAIIQRFGLANAKMPVPEGLSADQYRSMYPMGDIVDDLFKKQGIEAAAKERAAARKEAQELKKEGKMEDYTKDFRKELTSPSTIAGKAYSNFLSADKAHSAISTYAKNPSGYKDYASLMSALKALQGDESVVREAEIRLGMGAGSLMDSLSNTFSKAASGKMLQPKQRQQMVEAVDVLRNTYRDQFDRTAAPTLEQAKHLGLDASHILGKDFLGQPSSSAAPAMTQEVERKTKDGRIGIFDANTKKFLRYK